MVLLLRRNNLKCKECLEYFPAEMQELIMEMITLGIHYLSALQEITHIVHDINIWEILQNIVWHMHRVAFCPK